MVKTKKKIEKKVPKVIAKSKAKLVKKAPSNAPKKTSKPSVKKVVKKVVKAKAKPGVTKIATKQEVNIISPKLRLELSMSNIVTRGRIFVGKVVTSKAQKTVRVEWPRRYYLPKYERFEKRRTRVQAHNPKCLSVKLGDTVRISECRPISKTKKFVVIEKLEVKE